MQGDAARTAQRTDSLQDKLFNLFRGPPTQAPPAVISLPTSQALSGTSGDDEPDGAVPEGYEPRGPEARSFLDTVLPWRDVTPVPQTVSLRESNTATDDALLESEPAQPSPREPAAAGPVLSVTKLLRLLPSKGAEHIGPLQLHVRGVTGEEFDLSIPAGRLSELEAAIQAALEQQGRRGPQARSSRISFALDQFVQQLQIKRPPESAVAPSDAATAAGGGGVGAVHETDDVPLTQAAAQQLAASGGSVSGVSSDDAALATAAPLSLSNPLQLSRIPAVLLPSRRLTSFSVEGHNLASIDDVCAAEALEELRVTHCNLRESPATLLSSLARLRLLDLSHNLLTTVPVNSNAERLQFLSLAYNQMTAVPPQLCRMASLTDLDLSYNRLTNLPTELRLLRTLFRINLEGNMLVTPSVALIRGVMGSIDVVAQFPLLASLNLARNKITEFPEALNRLRALTELNLSDNRLTRIAPDLHELPSLARLDLSGNALGPDFPAPLLQMSGALNVLRVARNRLRSLPVGLTSLRSLVELDVSENALREVDPSCVTGLTHVAHFDASRNKLEKTDFVLEMAGLQRLKLSHNEIEQLPDDVFTLEGLQHLELAHNRLTELPASFERLYRLEYVDLSHNTLERLAPSWNVSSFPRLRTLLLEGNHKAVNRLHFSFSTLRALRSLSMLGMLVDLENIYIQNPARFDLSRVIEVTGNVRHPLLVAAFFGLATVPQYSEQCLHDGVDIMLSLCSVRESISGSLIVHDSWPPSDIYLPDTARFLALRCLTSLTHKMEANIPRWHIYVHGAPAVLMDIINRHPETRFKLMCIRLLGNLALHPVVKSQIFHEKSEIVTYLEDLARTTHSDSIKRFCNRTFAIFGICQHFHTSLISASLTKHTGVRILSLDGGGTRALATVEILKRVCELTGRRIVDMFDLIVGSSAGALLALGLLTGKTLDQCADMYLDKGHLVFAPQDEMGEEAPPASSWSKIMPMINLATKGAMYRSKSYEKSLRKFFGAHRTMIGTAENDSSPKVCAVTTLTSVKPAAVFLCRNYDYPPHRTSRHAGDVTWKVWEVCRATSAAPSYFDPFEREGQQFMDGGLVANNPAAIALHEARKIWGPSVPISLLLSVGTGCVFTKPVPKERGTLETLEQLVDAALSQQRVHEMLEDLLDPGVPYYRMQPMGVTYSVRLDETRKSELVKLQVETRQWIKEREADFLAIRELLVERKRDAPIVWDDDVLSGGRETDGDLN